MNTSIKHDDVSDSLESTIQSNGFFFPLFGFTPDRATEFAKAYRVTSGIAAQSEVLRSAFNAFKTHLLVTWVDAIVHCPAILDAVERILGPNILLWSTDIFSKPGCALNPNGSTCMGRPSDSLAGSLSIPSLVPAGLEWHQDSIHLGLHPVDHVVRCWIALTPTTPLNGTMRYLPSSHLWGEQPHGYIDRDADWRRGQKIAAKIDESRAVPVILSPGEFSMHDIRLVHDSGPNKTDSDRICLAATYISADVDPLGVRDSAMLVRGIAHDHNFDLEPRPMVDFGISELEAFAKAIVVRMRKLETICGSQHLR